MDGLIIAPLVNDGTGMTSGLVLALVLLGLFIWYYFMD